jgi:membrane protease YdiL (CAAX protease family)
MLITKGSFQQEQFIIVVTIGPLLETAIFQALPIEGCHTLFNRCSCKDSLAILASSLLFAVNHPFSLLYIIATFCSGIAYSTGYIIAKKRAMNAVVVVTLIHASYNLFSFIVNETIL